MKAIQIIRCISLLMLCCILLLAAGCTCSSDCPDCKNRIIFPDDDDASDDDDADDDSSDDDDIGDDDTSDDDDDAGDDDDMFDTELWMYGRDSLTDQGFISRFTGEEWETTAGPVIETNAERLDALVMTGAT